MTHRLETENLILRKPLADDWDDFYAFCLSDRSIGIGGPFSHKIAWRMFAAEIGHWEIRGFGMFVVTTKDSDMALGLVGPWHPDDWPEPELAWMVWGNTEGKGMAFEAASAVRDFAFNILGWKTAVSYIDKGIDRSATLAKRLGAKLDPNAPRPEGSNCDVYRHLAQGYPS